MSPEELLSIVKEKMEYEASPIPERPLREILKHTGKMRHHKKALSEGRYKRRVSPNAPFVPVPFDPSKNDLPKTFEAMQIQLGTKPKSLIVIKYQRQRTAMHGLIVFETKDVVVGCDISIWKDEKAREYIRQLFGHEIVGKMDGARSPPEGQCDGRPDTELQRWDSENPIRSGDGERRDAKTRSVDIAGAIFDDAPDGDGDQGD
jgi:hypothetical protein